MRRMTVVVAALLVAACMGVTAPEEVVEPLPQPNICPVSQAANLVAGVWEVKIIRLEWRSALEQAPDGTLRTVRRQFCVQTACNIPEGDAATGAAAIAQCAAG